MFEIGMTPTLMVFRGGFVVGAADPEATCDGALVVVDGDAAGAAQAPSVTRTASRIDNFLIP
jgi:hypothetical protein